jgi:Secretion system C-terminal sorting domain
MKKIALLGLFICLTNLALASHLRCGYITVHRTTCTSKTVIITITVFTNTSSTVKFGEDGILNFGDGQTFIIPGIDNTPRPDLGPNIGMASFTVNHTYAGLGQYLVSYVEPNRNGAVLNMSNSFFTEFYTETLFDLSLPLTCLGPPSFVAPPIFSGFTNSAITFSLGATSSAGTDVTYEMVVPFRGRGTPVVGYWEPENMLLNYLTGLLTWNTESAVEGEYNFAVHAVQWIKEGDVWRRAGYNRIDFQVILNGDQPENPVIRDNQVLDDYNRVLVPAGAEKKIRLFYEMDASYNPTLEMFSEFPSAAEQTSFVTYDSVSESTGKDIKVGLLTIAPDESHERSNPYIITIRGKHHVSPVHPNFDTNYLIYVSDELPPLPEPVITSTEKEIAQVEVFPNPVQHQINIHVNKPGASVVRIYSTQGALVKAKSFEGNTILMLSELPSGVYICDVWRNNTSVRRMKLIKN